MAGRIRTFGWIAALFSGAVLSACSTIEPDYPILGAGARPSSPSEPWSPSESAPQKLGKPYQISGIWYVPRHQPDYDESASAHGTAKSSTTRTRQRRDIRHARYIGGTHDSAATLNGGSDQSGEWPAAECEGQRSRPLRRRPDHRSQPGRRARVGLRERRHRSRACALPRPRVAARVEGRGGAACFCALQASVDKALGSQSHTCHEGRPKGPAPSASVPIGPETVLAIAAGVPRTSTSPATATPLKALFWRRLPLLWSPPTPTTRNCLNRGAGGHSDRADGPSRCLREPGQCRGRRFPASRPEARR